MSYELSNLNLRWVDQPEERWIDDLESMVEGYPFEQGRRDKLGEDRLSRLRSSWEGTDESPALLAAYFDAKLVGWLQLETDELLSRYSPTPLVRARHELVQRNRDDVRHHLLEAVRERFPEAVIQFRQPTQNRTARSYLLGQPDVVAGRTLVHLSRPEGTENRTSESKHNNLTRDPETMPDLAELLTLAHNDLLPSRHGEDLDLEEYSRDLIEKYATGDDRNLLALTSDSGTRAVLLLEERPNGSGTPIVRGRLVTKNDDLEGLPALLFAAEELVSEGTLELRLSSDRELLFETLQDLGYEPLTKRMLLYRFPSDRPAETGDPEGERSRS
jgi:hypothetical protein